MKKVLLVMLAVCTLGTSVNAQKIKNFETDKFTKQLKFDTTLERLRPVVDGAMWVNYRYFENSLHLVLYWVTTGVVAVDEGAEIMFLDNEGNVCAFYNNQYRISSSGGASSKFHSILNVTDGEGITLFLDGNFAQLFGKKITDIRIYTTQGYVERTIPENNQDALSRLTGLVLDTLDENGIEIDENGNRK